MRLILTHTIRPSVWLFMFAGLSFLFVLSANASAPDDEAYENGLELYDLSCSRCHGKTMVNPGASSFNLKVFPKDQKARFIESVTNGKGFMPAFGTIFDAEEIEQLWTYISRTAE